jgi:anaerobic selenocysteine-containing dehydrogenase
VDAFLPTASYAETEGTLTNVEGRVQRLVRIEDLADGAVHGFTRPDWLIFSRLAEKLGSTEFKYKDAQAVLREISRSVPGFPAKPDRKPRRLAAKARLPVEKRKARAAGKGRFALVAEPAGFGHCGVDLSSKVEGLTELALEEGFRCNPDDLRKLRVESGESIVVSNGQLRMTGSAKSDPECPAGVVYYHRPVAYGGLEHRAEFEPLYRLGRSPMKVDVRSAKATRRKTRKKRAMRKTPVAAN